MQSPLIYWHNLNSDTKRFLLICLLISFVLHILTAIYSIGFYMYDEHYQIIEFAWMKLGHSTVENMAWEYNAMSRPTLQPWIAIIVFKALGMSDPFKMAFVLRLLTSMLGLASLIPFCLMAMQWIKNNFLLKLFPFLLASLPIISFVHARFSSEGFSCIFLLAAISFILISSAKSKEENKSSAFWYLVFAGISFAIAFVCRIQIALTFPGIIVWLLFVNKMKFRKILILSFVMIIVLIMCAVLDRFYYGTWVNALWLYFKINFLDGKANSFGVSPFLFYFKTILSKLGFLWGWLFVLGMLIGWLRKSLNIFSLAFIPYFLFHCIIGHKELRFLFPMVPILPLFIIFAFDNLISSNSKKSSLVLIFLKSAFIIFLVSSELVWMADASLSPARLEFYAYKYMDRHRDQKLAFISNNTIERPYGPSDNLNMDFYKPRSLLIKYHEPDANQIRQILDTSSVPVYYYTFSDNLNPPNPLIKSGVHYNLEYYSLPDWVLKLKAMNILYIQSNIIVYRLYK